MKKTNYLFTILLAIVLFASQSCKKDETIIDKSDNAQYDKLLTIENYDPDYFPEDNYETLLQNYLERTYNFYHSNINVDNYNSSDGIWCLISALNYTLTNPLCKIEDVEERSYNIVLKLTDNSLINGNSLAQQFINAYDSLISENTDAEQLFIIKFNSATIGDGVINLELKVAKGKKANYKDVDLSLCPTGVPSNIILKMGIPSGSYQSAAKETQNRYNPYLWKSLNNLYQNPKTYYIIQYYYGGNNVDGWYDYDNCHYSWPTGDFILYVNCGQSTYLSAQVSGSRFNTYLNRYWQKRIVTYLNDNSTSSQYKYLYLTVHNYWSSGCNICGYINPYSNSSIGFIIYQGKIKELTHQLNTYIWQNI